MISPDEFQPLQLKGEIMDLEFTIDTDHRLAYFHRTSSSLLFTCRLINRVLPSTAVNHPKIGKGGETERRKVA